MTRSWSIASVGAALVFATFAVFQINDPDPWIWVPVYLVPAAVSGFGARGDGLHPAVPGLIAILYGGVAAWIGWAGVEVPDPMGGFPQVGALRLEHVREALGLAMVAGWMTALCWRSATRVTPRSDG